MISPEEIRDILRNRYVGHQGDKNPLVKTVIRGIADDVAAVMEANNPYFDRRAYVSQVEEYFDLDSLPSDEDRDTDRAWSNFGGWVC